MWEYDWASQWIIQDDNGLIRRYMHERKHTSGDLPWESGVPVWDLGGYSAIYLLCSTSVFSFFLERRILHVHNDFFHHKRTSNSHIFEEIRSMLFLLHCFSGTGFELLVTFGRSSLRCRKWWIGAAFLVLIGEGILPTAETDLPVHRSVALPSAEAFAAWQTKTRPCRRPLSHSHHCGISTVKAITKGFKSKPATSGRGGESQWALPYPSFFCDQT